MSKKWKKKKAAHDDVLHPNEFQQAAAVSMSFADIPNYREGTAEKQCANCGYFEPLDSAQGSGGGECEMYEAEVKANMVCDSWVQIGMKRLNKTGSPWYVDRDERGAYIVTDESGTQTQGPFRTYSEAEHAATALHRKADEGGEALREAMVSGYMANNDREASRLIEQGLVQVNGQIVNQPGLVLRFGDVVRYQGRDYKVKPKSLSKSTEEYAKLVASRLGIDGDVEEVKAKLKRYVGGANIFERNGQWVVYDLHQNQERGTFPSEDAALAAAEKLGYKSKAIDKGWKDWLKATLVAMGYGVDIATSIALNNTLGQLGGVGPTRYDPNIGRSLENYFRQGLSPQEAASEVGSKSKSVAPGSRVKVLRTNKSRLDAFEKPVQKGDRVVLNLDGVGAIGKVTKVQGTDAWVDVKGKSRFVKLGAICKGVEEPGIIGMVDDDGNLVVDLDDGTQTTVPADSGAFVPEEVEGELLGPFADEDDAEVFAGGLNEDVNNAGY